jgi:phage terminase large subunit
LWTVIEITGDPDDPRRSPRISVEHAREQIAQYGRDNPWVLVNIFGQFPPSSINTLIGPDEMTAAERRSYQESEIAHAAKILGVDVARFGDDASVIFPRQGLVAFTPFIYRNLDSLQGAGVVAHKWREFDAQACFIDSTGGYGAGWVDALRALGRSPIEVSFAGEPNDRRYFNKRAEMYFECVEWIKKGGQLPPCPELVAALTQTTYTYRGDRLLLEDKAQIKERIGFSPDHADALAMTFAQPVLSHALTERRRNPVQIRSDYHPIDSWDNSWDRARGGNRNVADGPYRPYGVG